MRTILVIAATVLACSAASADDGEIRCNPEGANLEMAACARDDFAKADAALNAAFSELLAKTKAMDADQGAPVDGWPGAEESLRAAQRAWIDLRDKECALRTISEMGGSLRQITYPACQADLTEKRTKDLRDLLAALQPQ